MVKHFTAFTKAQVWHMESCRISVYVGKSRIEMQDLEWTFRIRTGDLYNANVARYRGIPSFALYHPL